MRQPAQGRHKRHPDHTGRTTVQDVMKRLVLGTPTVAQRAADAAFYSDVHKVLGRVFDDPEILARLGSQRAASPARGITDLMRVLDAIKEDSRVV